MVTDQDVAEFERQRPRLFGLAYRMLGSAQEAEDAVQDAYVRWSGARQDAIEAPGAWLAKVVTNLALNRLTSARVLRERYVGPWLPEPVVTDHGALDPSDTAQQRDAVSYALLVLLERLTPAERAVFVLREAFGYRHGEIAKIVDLSEAHCRQLHRRARQRVGRGGSRFRADSRRLRELVDTFLAAARDGDLPVLERLLAADVTAWSDGGGRVNMARKPILGRDRVARYLAGGMARFTGEMAFTVLEVNGGLALAGREGGALVGLLIPEARGVVVTAVRTIANPDKLGYIATQLGWPVRTV